MGIPFGSKELGFWKFDPSFERRTRDKPMRVLFFAVSILAWACGSANASVITLIEPEFGLVLGQILTPGNLALCEVAVNADNRTCQSGLISDIAVFQAVLGPTGGQIATRL